MPVALPVLERRFTDSAMAATSCSREASPVETWVTGSRHRYLNCDVAHRDIHYNRIIAELDFVASAVGAAQDGVHRCCLLMSVKGLQGKATTAHLPMIPQPHAHVSTAYANVMVL
jgi:hypothetical protein